MKTTVLIIFFISIFISTTAQPYLWTSKSDGGWSGANTWNIPAGVSGQTFPQTTDDDVVINHDITLDAGANNPTVKSVSITYNNAVARLNMGSQTLSMTGDFTTTGIGPGWSDFTISGGTLNVGVASTDSRFFIKNGLISISGQTVINIGGYLKYTGGTFNFADEVDIIISKAGTRNDDVESNFFIGQNVTVNGAGNVDLDYIIENGNQGTAPEAYVEVFGISLGAGGNITSTFQNLLGSTDHLIKSDTDLGWILSDIGGTDTLFLERITGYDTIRVADLNITSGTFKVPLETTLRVTNDFASISNQNFVVDGELFVDNELALAGDPNNINGDGIVQAGTYTLSGSNTVFGIVPEDGTKSASGNWFGNVDNDWFNAANWNRLPNRNRPVLIYSDFNLGNYPKIVSTDPDADSRTLELRGTGAKLTIEGSQLIIHQSGNSGRNGYVIVGTNSQLDVTGGVLAVDTDVDIGNSGELSVTGGGAVRTGRDMDVEQGGKLNITGLNSQVSVGGN